MLGTSVTPPIGQSGLKKVDGSFLHTNYLQRDTSRSPQASIAGDVWEGSDAGPWDNWLTKQFTPALLGREERSGKILTSQPSILIAPNTV